MMNEVTLREYCNSATPGNYSGDEPCHPLRNTGNGATLDRVTATPIRAKSLRHRDLEEAGAGPCREGRQRDLDQKLVVAEREGTAKEIGGGDPALAVGRTGAQPRAPSPKAIPRFQHAAGRRSRPRSAPPTRSSTHCAARQPGSAAKSKPIAFTPSRARRSSTPVPLSPAPRRPRPLRKGMDASWPQISYE
jgi:hypothetical protein